MTNEQAAIKLQNILNDDTYSWHPAHAEALRMAVEALKANDLVNESGGLANDSQGDLISRREAIKTVHDEFDGCLVWDESGEQTANEVERIIDSVPSAQPEPEHEYTMEEFMYGQELGDPEDGSL